MSDGHGRARRYRVHMVATTTVDQPAESVEAAEEYALYMARSMSPGLTWLVSHTEELEA